MLRRFALALIHGAQSRGFDLESIYRSGSKLEPFTANSPEIALESLNSIDLAIDSSADLRVIDAAVHGIGEIDESDFIRFYRNVKVMMLDDFFGITEKPCKLGAFMLMVEFVISCRTLRESLLMGTRYYSAISDDVSIELKVEDDLAFLEVTLRRPKLDPYHFFYDFWGVIWLHLSSWLIGETIPILRADFPHPQEAGIEEYQYIYGNDCRFDQTSARFYFFRKYLSRPVNRSLDALKDFVAIERFDLVSVQGIDGSLATKVKTYLHYNYSTEHQFDSMEKMAEHFHMSSQTLRRRLEKEGTSYRAIKESIRRLYVMQWLSNPDIPIKDIAEKSGFKEPGALSRAVKHWTGMSPTDYRESQLDN
jgi:AraC-like DNA-binding protein